MMYNEKKKPTVYLICGFIGAGKTTFARKLEKETGAVRITKDEWMVQIFGNSSRRDGFAEDDRRVTKLAQEFALRLIEAGVDVIIDEGFWERSQRDEIRDKIKKIGGKPVLYYVRQPVETMRKQTLERSKNPPIDSFEIDGEMFDGYLQYWQSPEEDEDYFLAE